MYRRLDYKWILQIRHFIQSNFEYLETLRTIEDKNNPLFLSLKNYFSINFSQRFNLYAQTYLLYFSHGANGPFEGDKNELLLLPGIDLLNHNTYNRPQGPVVIRNQEDGTESKYYGVFNMKESIQAGEEIFSTYDPIEVFEMKNKLGNSHKHCNTMLFRRYGFVLDDHDRDCYTMHITIDYIHRIIYKYGEDTTTNANHHYFYAVTENNDKNHFYMNGIDNECRNVDINNYELFLQEILDGGEIIYRKNTPIFHYFSLNKDTNNVELTRCRYQVMYFILQNEVVHLVEKKNAYAEQKKGYKEETVLNVEKYEIPTSNSEYMMNIIHNGYMNVLKFFIEQIYAESFKYHTN